MTPAGVQGVYSVNYSHGLSGVTDGNKWFGAYQDVTATGGDATSGSSAFGALGGDVSDNTSIGTLTINS